MGLYKCHVPEAEGKNQLSNSPNGTSCCDKQLAFTFHYRPHTKFAKVMFSQMSLCPQWGSLSRGSQSRGVLCPGGLCPGGVSGRPPYSYVRAVHILLECILVQLCLGLAQSSRFLPNYRTDDLHR